ncbi:MAG: FAD-binding oxidoreductase [Hydrogenophilales bacterium]|nr:FAD-binding oxidoreductase [Hydrogenophilales bacterium]
MTSDLLPRNRYPKPAHQVVLNISDRARDLPAAASGTNSVLPRGNGRSYGDVCLNDGGTLLVTRRLDRFIAWDRSTGRLICESGVLLADILKLVVPQGWFLPVTPGTRLVSVGGAIANDVHGKNHHVAGSFGHHVIRFELLRTDGERKLCVSGDDWYRASVGGLGLTGLITWAELQLMPVANSGMLTESLRFSSLADFRPLNRDAETRWPYTVSWIDCLAVGRARGRGILMAGAHASPLADPPEGRVGRKSMPFDPPFSLINRISLSMFNVAYYHRPLPKGPKLVHYNPYFYPLDAIQNWNRIYGQRGFFQYQCVIPPNAAEDAIQALLTRISSSGMGSFLAVLKTFGRHHPPAGMLSFPRPGATLALDFPNLGAKCESLFRQLDSIVLEAEGALYPAKDARMSSEMFRHSFPAWEAFSQYIDPCISSGFWRRVVE